MSKDEYLRMAQQLSGFILYLTANSTQSSLEQNQITLALDAAAKLKAFVMAEIKAIDNKKENV